MTTTAMRRPSRTSEVCIEMTMVKKKTTKTGSVAHFSVAAKGTKSQIKLARRTSTNP